MKFLPAKIHGLGTDYAVGAMPAISLRQHLALDALAGGLFVVLAIFAGFEAVTAAFYGVVGAAVLAVVAVTELDEAPAAAAAIA